MTYNVLMGTLHPTHSLTYSLRFKKQFSTISISNIPTLTLFMRVCVCACQYQRHVVSTMADVTGIATTPIKDLSAAVLVACCSTSPTSKPASVSYEYGCVVLRYRCCRIRIKKPINAS